MPFLQACILPCPSGLCSTAALLKACLTILGLEGVSPYPVPCPIPFCEIPDVCCLFISSTVARSGLPWRAVPFWTPNLTGKMEADSISLAASNFMRHLHKQKIWLCSQAQSHKMLEHYGEQREYRLFYAKNDFSLLQKKKKVKKSKWKGPRRAEASGSHSECAECWTAATAL